MGKIVYDNFGRRIGSVTNLPDGKKHVYDADQQPLGKVSQKGTFGVTGNLVSRTPMAGLLFRGKQKK